MAIINYDRVYTDGNGRTPSECFNVISLNSECSCIFLIACRPTSLALLQLILLLPTIIFIIEPTRLQVEKGLCKTSLFY